MFGKILKPKKSDMSEYWYTACPNAFCVCETIINEMTI